MVSRNPARPALRGFDLVSFFNDFESGNATEQQVRDGFQYLVDTGLAWQLQGSYGRAAAAMLEAGVINPPCQS